MTRQSDLLSDKYAKQLRASFLAVTLVLAGVSGSVVLTDTAEAATNTTAIDDFEDNDINIEAANWTGWSGDTASLSPTSTVVLAGSYSANLTSSGTIQTVEATTDSSKSRLSSFQADIQINATTGASADDVTIGLFNESNNRYARTKFKLNGTIFAGGENIGTWSAGTAYSVSISDIDYANETYDVKVTSGGSTVASKTDVGFTASARDMASLNIENGHQGTGTVTATIDDVTATTNTIVDGRVLNQDGAPVSNATVQVWAVNSSLSADPMSTLDNASNVVPDTWNPDLQLDGAGGAFSQASNEYVAVTQTQTADAPFILDSADLSEPLLKAPAGEKLTVTIWNPNEQGFFDQPVVGSEYARQLHGAPVDSGTVVIEQLSATGGATTKRTVELDKTVGGGYLDPSQLHYGEVEGLPAGYYRVSAKNSDFSYVIQVGEPSQIFDRRLQKLSGSLTERSEWVQNKLSDGTFRRATVTTNSNGEFRADVGQDVTVVGIQAIKAGSLSTDSRNLTVSKIRNNSDSLNGSFYFPSRVYKKDVPARNLTIRMQEVTYPGHGNLTAYSQKLNDLLSKLENGSFSELPPALQQRLENVNRDELEDLYAKLDDLREQNEQLREMYENKNQNETIDIDVSQASDQELRERVSELQTSLNQLQSTIDSEQVSSSTGPNGTVSRTWAFGSNLKPSNVAVRVDYTNGTTHWLNATESDYVSVENRFGGDRVTLQDYSLGDASGAKISVIIANSDGIGKAVSRAANPAVDGDIPKIDAVDFSSLSPGPNESVRMTVHSDHESFRNVSSVTVWEPDGQTAAVSNVSNGRTVNMTTAEPGIYRVEFKIGSTSGKAMTEVVRLKVSETDQNRPASVRAKSGVVGTYAITGEDLRGGSVDIKAGGSEVSFDAVIPEDHGPPSTLHVYQSGLTVPSDSTTRITVVWGEQKKALQKHVQVTLHRQALPNPDGDGLMSGTSQVWREAGGDSQPLPQTGEGQYGETIVHDTNTSIRTYTTEDGSVGVNVVGDPGPIQQASYWLAVNGPNIDVPLTAGVMSWSTGAAASP